MRSEPQAFAYELLTSPSATSEAAVLAVSLAILDRQPDTNLYRWIVAATADQALRFRDLAWVITPRQLGAMRQEGEDLVYRDRASGESWSVSIEALAGGEAPF